MEDREQEDLIKEFEATLESKKRVAAKGAKTSRFEPLYMLIFEIVVIVSLGAFEGFSREQLKARAEIKKGLDWFSSIGQDIKDLASGYIEHIAMWWYVDLALLALTLLTIFCVKPRERTRRFFRLVVAATVVVIGSMVARAILDTSIGLREYFAS